MKKSKGIRGRAVLKTALLANPLEENIYLMLGRSRLYDENIRDRDFEQGLSELRAAARLGRSRNDISAETGLQMLAFWPHLDEKERQECGQLLIRGIHVLDTGILVRTWWRYSKDRDLLASVLETRPEVMRIAADTLTRMGAPLELRWRLLAANERLAYAQMRNEYSQAHSSGRNQEELAKRMEVIVGYGSLLDPNDPDWQRYTIFKERILLEALENVVRQYRHHPGKEARQRSIKLLRRVLRDTRKVDLIGVESLMEELGIWERIAGEEGVLLRARLYLRTANYSRALELSETSARMKGESTAALLVATRAAMAMKLMILASGHVQSILDGDPENMEANCLLRVIQGELSVKISQDEARRLMSGCHVTLSGGMLKRRIPMIPGESIVVQVPEVVSKQKRLLHIRVNGRVVLEQYISSEGDEQSIPMDTLGMDPGEMIEVVVLLTVP